MDENKTNQVVEEEDFFNMDESDFTDIPTEEESYDQYYYCSRQAEQI